MKSFIIVLSFLLFSIFSTNAQSSLLKGKISDKSTSAIASVKLNFINASTGESIFESKSNSTTGEYTCVISLDHNADIKIEMESTVYPKQSKIYHFNYTGEYQEIKFDITVDKTLQILSIPKDTVVVPKAKKTKTKKRKNRLVR